MEPGLRDQAVPREVRHEHGGIRGRGVKRSLLSPGDDEHHEKAADGSASGYDFGGSLSGNVRDGAGGRHKAVDGRLHGQQPRPRRGRHAHALLRRQGRSPQGDGPADRQSRAGLQDAAGARAGGDPRGAGEGAAPGRGGADHGPQGDRGGAGQDAGADRGLPRENERSAELAEGLC